MPNKIHDGGGSPHGHTNTNAMVTCHTECVAGSDHSSGAGGGERNGGLVDRRRSYLPDDDGSAHTCTHRQPGCATVTPGCPTASVVHGPVGEMLHVADDREAVSEEEVEEEVDEPLFHVSDDEENPLFQLSDVEGRHL